MSNCLGDKSMELCLVMSLCFFPFCFLFRRLRSQVSEQAGKVRVCFKRKKNEGLLFLTKEVEEKSVTVMLTLCQLSPMIEGIW